MKTTFFSVVLALAVASTTQAFIPMHCSSLETRCRTAQNANQSFCSAQNAACKKCEDEETKCSTAANANMSYCSSQRAKCDSKVPMINAAVTSKAPVPSITYSPTQMAVGPANTTVPPPGSSSPPPSSGASGLTVAGNGAALIALVAGAAALL